MPFLKLASIYDEQNPSEFFDILPVNKGDFNHANVKRKRETDNQMNEFEYNERIQPIIEGNNENLPYETETPATTTTTTTKASTTLAPELLPYDENYNSDENSHAIFKRDSSSFKDINTEEYGMHYLSDIIT
jgi:hypothetical protein